MNDPVADPGGRAGIDNVLAADVGGTFTDVIVSFADGSTAALKLPSSPPAYEASILAAAAELVGDATIPRLAHGTTVATNALLEAKGAVTAVVTTEGFRDVLELARLRRPSLFDAGFVKPPPLVPRNRRFEVRERTAADGTCLVEPSKAEVHRLAERLRRSGVEAVAICLINSYADPGNEERVRDWLVGALPDDVIVTTSSEIQREIREYERTSTTVINAYVAPAVARYLNRLRHGVERSHRTTTVQIMQSNGSLIPEALAARFPCRLIESGPAAGVLAAAAEVADINGGDAIAFDMGGTTAKAALIEAGRPFEALQLEVGSAMNRDGASMSGSGYVIRAPSLDISEVGAGGGSIVWIDRTGVPHVGPASAGADPGPACYDRGGDEPTVTDANLVLGFLNPGGIAGGRVALRPDRAEAALRQRIADPLDVDLETAAWGVHILANVGMEAALRAVSVERGRSPARYVLVAYGGAGPMHAATLAESFGMTSVLIPPRPGLLCARGLLLASIRQDGVVAYPPGHPIEVGRLRSIVAGLQPRLEAMLRDEMPGAPTITLAWRLGVRYVGQPTELLLPFDPDRDLAGDDEQIRSAVRERFGAEHERTYGYADAHAPMELVSIRAAATGHPDDRTQPTRDDDARRRAVPPGADRAGSVGRRAAYFGPDHGWIDTPVHARRRDVTGLAGPVIIDEPDATVVVPPGWTVACDDRDRLLLDRDVR